MLGVATAVFTYYTVWTFVIPFVDDSHPFTALFPPRQWAIRIPALLLVLGVAVIGTFVGSVISKNAKKEQAKLAQKKKQ